MTLPKKRIMDGILDKIVKQKLIKNKKKRNNRQPQAQKILKFKIKMIQQIMRIML